MLQEHLIITNECLPVEKNKKHVHQIAHVCECVRKINIRVISTHLHTCACHMYIYTFDRHNLLFSLLCWWIYFRADTPNPQPYEWSESYGSPGHLCHSYSYGPVFSQLHNQLFAFLMYVCRNTLFWSHFSVLMPQLSDSKNWHIFLCVCV